MKVVVTGGAGYIGSHTCKAIAARGWIPIVVDNLSTGHQEAVRWGDLHELDIRETEHLTRLLQTARPAGVLHFAASAYVGESMSHPLRYYDNNVNGTLSLVRACISAGVRQLIFSSTCAVYGTPPQTPIPETAPTVPVNPYGETKLACERLLHWAGSAHELRWAALRYFNAAGADPQGEIGELHEPETHLIPLAFKATARTGLPLSLFGDDYPTRDGTAIRDYIHVTDLAEAHVRALSYLVSGGGSRPINLGTGRGHTVREVIAAVERVTGRSVPHAMAPRRPGDPAELWAASSLASRLLDWTPRYSDLDFIIRTAWAWEQRQCATASAGAADHDHG